MNSLFKSKYIRMGLLVSFMASSQLTTAFAMTAIEKAALKKLESALAFTIPKNMHRTLNAIQWTFEHPKKGTPIMSNRGFSLSNMVVGKAIKMQKRITRAANFGWASINSKHAKVRVEKHGGGQIRYGDTVRLHMKNYGYFGYSKNSKATSGANVRKVSKNKSKWKIGGGVRGKKLVSGMPFVLNIWSKGKNKGDIVLCKRPYGLDWGFRGISKCGGALAKISGTVWGPNGALSGDGLTGQIAKKWKDKLCKTAIKAGSVYANATTGGVAASAVNYAERKAINKCKAL